RIRKVDRSGIITTVAGTCILGAPVAVVGSTPAILPLGSQWPVCGPTTQATAASPVAITIANGRTLFTFIDGTAGVNATLNSPRGLAVDSAGNLYIADTGTNRIRVLSASNGTLSTVVGSGTAAGFSGDGGIPNRSLLSAPRVVAVNPTNGNLYIADQTQGVISTAASVSGRIRLVDLTNNVITSLNAPLYGGDSASADNALFNDIRGLGTDSAGNLIIVDTLNHRIRKVAADGTISTIAGSGTSGNTGDTGPAITARLSNPNCVAVDAANSIYIADRSNNRIRKIDATGVITTVAGGGTLDTPSGIPATSAILNAPRCVAVDAIGNLYIADTGNHAVRKVDVNGTISTVAGVFIPNPIPFNPTTGARNVAFIGVTGAVVVGTGPTGPVVNTPAAEPSGDLGPGTSAYLNGPQGIAVDAEGKNLYIADTGNSALRRVDLATGIIYLVAGGYNDGGADGLPAGFTAPTTGVPANAFLGPAQFTRLNVPLSVALDGSGNVFVADTGNNRIVQIDPAGNAIVIAGALATATTWGDNKGATSVFFLQPRAVTADGKGNVYFSDPIGTVRKLSKP
ncbi:MAG: hypothetical protein ABIZ80_04270, partial [Bryobacteraceae bacterium]